MEEAVIESENAEKKQEDSSEQTEGPLPQVIVIVGATGTGKSKLGAELALHLNGEVLSADSMQVFLLFSAFSHLFFLKIYKGLDVATNKMTEEEMLGIPHHLIGFLSPKVLEFNVSTFVSLALPIVIHFVFFLLI